MSTRVVKAKDLSVDDLFETVEVVGHTASGIYDWSYAGQMIQYIRRPLSVSVMLGPAQHPTSLLVDPDSDVTIRSSSPKPSRHFGN